jgi:chromosomal replication initiation ATPase DnaA
MAEQLAFDLPYRPALDREDFLVADCNARAVSLIDTWPDGSDPVRLICGPAACGKSHLAAVWGLHHRAAIYPCSALRLDRLDALMDALMDGGALVIDNLENLLPENEETLFHLINHTRQSAHDASDGGAGSLLLLSRQPAEQITVKLPDLKSRLSALITARMDAPCDMLMAAVMVKLFNDRQLHITDKVVQYIVPRLERSFATLNRVVSDIDKAALKGKRPVTVPLVSELFGRMETDYE